MLGEGVQSEEMVKGEEKGFRIKTMSKVTSTSTQTVRAQVEECERCAKSANSSHSNEGVKEKYCCNLEGCVAKFARRGNLENHSKKVHGFDGTVTGVSNKLGEHNPVASCAVLADRNQPTHSSLLSPCVSENIKKMLMEVGSAQTYRKEPKNNQHQKVTCAECGMQGCIFPQKF